MYTEDIKTAEEAGSPVISVFINLEDNLGAVYFDVSEAVTFDSICLLEALEETSETEIWRSTIALETLEDIASVDDTTNMPLEAGEYPNDCSTATKVAVNIDDKAFDGENDITDDVSSTLNDAVNEDGTASTPEPVDEIDGVVIPTMPVAVGVNPIVLKSVEELTIKTEDGRLANVLCGPKNDNDDVTPTPETEVVDGKAATSEPVVGEAEMEVYEVPTTYEEGNDANCVATVSSLDDDTNEVKTLSGAEVTDENFGIFTSEILDIYAEVVEISTVIDDRIDDVCCTLEDNTADVKSPSGAEAADETICVLASDIFDVEETTTILSVTSSKIQLLSIFLYIKNIRSKYSNSFISSLSSRWGLNISS